MHPWLTGSAILIIIAIVLGRYFDLPGLTASAFVVGILVALLGARLVFQPAARFSGYTLTLTDPRGIALRSRTYSLEQVRRVVLETRHQGIPHRFRNGVLLVNLNGVAPEKIEMFVQEIRARNVDIDDCSY